MLAETAELAVLLRLKDEMSGGIARAEKELSGLNKTAATTTTRSGGISGAFGSATKAAHGFGGALGHAGSQLRGLALGPLGLLGVSTSLLTVGGLMHEAFGKAQEFGGEVKRLSALTGLAAETTSSLARAFEHFDVSADKSEKLIGFLEKNIGNLAAQKNGIAAFQKTFGLALTDSTGHLLDANEQILKTADYFNNESIPATTKAAALSKLYGRSWQDLIPVLAAGRQGIAAAEQQAKEFGLTLTTENLAALKEARTATRNWGDALGGLELQLGVALLPSLTEFTKTATDFVSHNRDEIIGFFKEGAKWAGQLGKAIKDYVIPTFGLIKSGWEAIPEPIRQVVLAGVIGGKVSKFLFNFGPLDLAKSLGGGLFGQFLGRGSPANPMWVRQVGLPGGGGVPVPGGGGMSGLAKVALIGEAIGLVAAVEGVREQLSSDNSQFAGAIADQTKQYLAQNPSKADLENSLGAIDKGIRDLRANPLNVLVQGDALDKLTQMRADVAAQLYALGQIPAAVAAAAADAIAHDPKAAEASRQFDAGANQEFNDQSPAMIRASKLVATRVDALTALFRVDLARLIGATKDNDIRKFAGKITDALVKGRAGDPTLVSTQNRLSELKDAVKALQNKKLHTHDPETARILGNDIAKLNRKIADRELVMRQFQKEQAILASSESTSRKITDLTSIQRYLKNTGHPHAAATIAKEIAAMKLRLAQTTQKAGEVAAAAIRKKKQIVDVNVSNTVHVTTNVSARQIRTAEVVVKRYGNTAVGWT